MQIVSRLWIDPEPFDFSGRFYQMKKAELAPKPIQRPRPPVMSAAGSDRGRRFAAQYCDVCFIAPESYDLQQLKAKVDRYRNYAREEYGRDIQVWSNAYVFHGDNEADGKALWHHCVEEKGDWAGVQNMLDVMGVNSQLVPPQVLEFSQEALYRRLVRLPAGRRQASDRRGAYAFEEGRLRRDSSHTAPLGGRHDALSGRGDAATDAGGLAL